MKKLTKRNRRHNRKVVFGYHAECDPGDVSDYTTVLTKEGWFARATCTGANGGCCDRDLTTP